MTLTQREPGASSWTSGRGAVWASTLRLAGEGAGSADIATGASRQAESAWARVRTLSQTDAHRASIVGSEIE
jgi:hypothetical protein